MTHHSESAIPAIAGRLNGLIKLRSIFLRLCKGHGKRPRHNIAMIGHRIVKGDGRASRHPDRHLSLQRLGTGCGGGELPICPIMGHIPLPKLAHQRQHLLHIAPAVTLRQSRLHPVKFALISPRAQTQIQAAIRQEINHCSFTRQIDRVPIGGIGHTTAQTDAFGVIRPPGHDLKRIGRNGHFKSMVLCCPSNLKASAISHLDHLEHVIAHRTDISLCIHTL